MKSFFTIAFLVFLTCSYPGNSQINQSKIDSLYQIVAESQDTQQIGAYIRLATHFIKNDSASAVLNLLEGDLPIIKKRGTDYQIGVVYEYIALGYDINGQLEKSVVNYEIARTYHEKVADNQESINLLDINTGVAYYYGGDFTNALTFFLKGYEDAKRFDFQGNLAKCLNNIAAIYRNKEQHYQALRFYKESIILKKSDAKIDSNSVAATYGNIGLCYSHMDQIDSSMLYFQKAKKLYQQTGETQELAHLNLQIASSYHKTNEYDKAYPILKELQKNNYQHLPETFRFNAMTLLADVDYHDGKLSESLSAITQAIDEFSESTHYTTLKEAYEIRALIQSKLDNGMQAFESIVKANEIGEIVASENKQKEAVKQQTKFETILKEAEIEQLQLKDELNNLKINRQASWIIAMTLGLALLGFLLYRLRLYSNKISTQNSIIQKALNEKDILLREIHHRVKNNLQLVSSLLTLQSRSIEDQEAITAINEGKARVRSMALIHQDLYVGEHLTGVKAQTYLEKLTTELFNTYNIDQSKIKLDLVIQDLEIDVDTIVPLGLIINELVTNSLKYAFANQDGGNLSVSLKEEDNQLKLKVADDGSGYDPNNIRDKAFGTTLMDALTQQLSGSKIIESSPQGTEVIIAFSDYKVAS